MTIIGIILAALAMQTSQLQTTAPPANSSDDIVVLARRLRKVRWEYEAKGGILSKCKIKRTSGSASIDMLVCQASAQCAEERPNFSDAELLPCIRDRVPRLYTAR